MSTQSKKYIKVPEGLIRKANQMGILHIISFWYELKSKKREGRFLKSELFNLGYSQSYVYKLINSLKNLNLIKDNTSSIQLCKYDDMFLELGFDLTPKDYGRKGKFKIFKVRYSKPYFIEYIAKEEIKLLFARQTFRATQSLRKLSNTETNLKSLIKFRNKFENLIGCRGLAKLLGYSYSSAAIGMKIEHNMVKLGLIEIISNIGNGLTLCNEIILL